MVPNTTIRAGARTAPLTWHSEMEVLFLVTRSLDPTADGCLMPPNCTRQHVAHRQYREDEKYYQIAPEADCKRTNCRRCHHQRKQQFRLLDKQQTAAGGREIMLGHSHRQRHSSSLGAVTAGRETRSLLVRRLSRRSLVSDGLLLPSAADVQHHLALLDLLESQDGLLVGTAVQGLAVDCQDFVTFLQSA